ncbi:HK97 gp10 family phage protein [Tepidibacter hydrothermalis]|uniref:HK97 gp10 family phage protein n=1 Tax=Tepidibacter hydrothermalis TaxID=3036126 RepID=A0ABY8EHQ7_9FIRM|nr:HK97 gp10 family phage protein [Tepidibacter hydrothermalis]WFD12461.1 HK97 gp10 family phage protein [Tepidibacter hydrothermalis]
MSNVYGLDEVLRELDMMADETDEAMDEIAKEVATEILDEAIKNVDGANRSIDKYKGKLIELPYPVRSITGTLKRSLKIKKLGNGKYKVFSDSTICNYSWWIHEGTKKMEARPYLDDAVRNVMDTRKYIEIANSIIEDILDRR